MGSINLLEVRRNILMSQPHLTTGSANPLTFQTDISANLKDCKIHFEPIQEGSGDPSPDNVRPISGWDGVTVWQYAEDVLDGLSLTWKLGSCIYPGGRGSINAYTKKGACAQDFIDVTKYRGKRLTLNHAPEPGNAGWCFYREKAVSVNSYVSGVTSQSDSSVVEGGPWTVTVPDEAVYMRFSCHPDYLDDVHVFVEPTSLTIPFPQTIYGGYVDLMNGVLVETWGFIASYSNETLPGIWISDRDVYAAGTAPTIGAQVAYELLTPVTYQLAPQTLKTLRGINNIWSNANGNIEVKFWKH